MEVYRAWLLRLMFPNKQAVARLQAKLVTASEAANIVSQYKLAAKPIDVIQK